MRFDMMDNIIKKLSSLELCNLEGIVLPLMREIAERGTGIKCPTSEKLGLHCNHINFIPSEKSGVCTDELIVVCLDKDNLDDRLREMIYHAGIYCSNNNKKVIFLTSKWETKIFEKHRRACSRLESKGITFRFILIGKDSINEIK